MKQTSRIKASSVVPSSLLILEALSADPFRFLDEVPAELGVEYLDSLSVMTFVQ